MTFHRKFRVLEEILIYERLHFLINVVAGNSMLGRAQKGEEIMALTKGKWSPEEDQKLIAYIKENHIWNWNGMPKAAGLLRSGKSCRLRWMNYLRPGLKHGKFTKEEEETMLQLHEKLGNRWSSIAAKLPGRTDNEIKNYCNTRLRKNLKSYRVKASTKVQEQKTLEIATDRKNSSEPTYSIPPPIAYNDTDPVTDNLKVELTSELQTKINLQAMANTSSIEEMSGDHDRTMEDLSGYSGLSAGDHENLFVQQFSPDYVWVNNGLTSTLDGFWIEEFVFPHAWQ